MILLKHILQYNNNKSNIFLLIKKTNKNRMYWNKNNHALFFGIWRKYERDDGNHENKKKCVLTLNRKIDFVSELSSTIFKT